MLGCPRISCSESQDVVTQIFASAGLAVRWTDTAPQFTVTIVPQVLGYARASSPVMGIARRSPDGLMVQVFFRQVQDFARTYRSRPQHDPRARDRARSWSPALARRCAFPHGPDAGGVGQGAGAQSRQRFADLYRSRSVEDSGVSLIACAPTAVGICSICVTIVANDGAQDRRPTRGL